MELLVLLLDVGQGESTIVIERRFQNDEWTPTWTAVIDGGFPTPGRGAIIRYLRALKISRIDHMVCTHFDGDHTRGLTDFLKHHVKNGKKRVSVDCLIVRNANDQQKKSDTKTNLLNAAKDMGIRIETPQKDACIKGLRGPVATTVKCIHVDGTELQDVHGTGLRDENDGSIALVFEFPGFEYYTAGDLPTAKEDGLFSRIRTNDSLFAFKCGHHGSNGSTSEAFLNNTKPAIALISCGDQGFGHPTYGVIERLLSCPTMKLLFLTNCIHNRKGVNPAYESTKITLKTQYDQKIKEFYRDQQLPTDYGEPYLNCIQDLLQSLKPDSDGEAKPDENTRKIRAVLNAAKLAYEHDTKHIPPGVQAIVAGSATHLGTIALRFTRRVVAGCYEQKQNAWKWWDAEGQLVEDGGDNDDRELAATLMTAVVKGDGQTVDEPDSPKLKKSNDTTNYKLRMADRQSEGGYARFTKLTIAGLREPNAGVPFVPFCEECREDRPDEEVYEVGCSDDCIHYFHNRCFSRHWTDKVPKKRVGLDVEKEKDRKTKRDRTGDDEDHRPRRAVGLNVEKENDRERERDPIGDDDDGKHKSTKLTLSPPDLEADSERGRYQFPSRCRCIFCQEERCECKECEGERKERRALDSQQRDSRGGMKLRSAAGKKD
jgi:beta-lactamase superfamily II metal-dependent hydrolase